MKRRTSGTALRHARAEDWPGVQALAVVGLCGSATVTSRFADSWDELTCPACLRAIAEARSIVLEETKAGHAEELLRAQKAEAERKRQVEKAERSAALRMADLGDRIAELERERDLLKENAWRAYHGEDPVFQPIADQPVPDRLDAAEKQRDDAAAECNATRMFELGEQMTALRKERDDAQAELAEVAKVLDNLAPRHQYDSLSASVREALEAHRKQRDEAIRLSAVEARAAKAQLEEARAQIASLKATIPLGTAELQEKVAELIGRVRELERKLKAASRLDELGKSCAQSRVAGMGECGRCFWCVEQRAVRWETIHRSSDAYFLALLERLNAWARTLSPNVSNGYFEILTSHKPDDSALPRRNAREQAMADVFARSSTP